MGEISCVVVQWLSARHVKLIEIHLGFKCVEGVGHQCKFPGQVVHCGGSRTNKRYPSIFLHSLSMAMGRGVVVLPGSAESVSAGVHISPPQHKFIVRAEGHISHCGRVYEERRVRDPLTVVTASPAPKFFSQGVLRCHHAKLPVRRSYASLCFHFVVLCWWSYARFSNRMSYVWVHLRGSVQVSGLMGQCPSVLVRAQVLVIL
eukprot:g82658.t1